MKLNLTLCICAAFVLSACGGGSGGGSPIASTPAISGVASKGPLNGANVCAYTVVSGAKGALIGNCVTTDQAGNYSIANSSYTGPVILEATGGTYVDEASGAVVSLTTTLRTAIPNVTPNTFVKASVTALTEIAYQSALNATGGITATNAQDAATLVQNAFGVADILATQPVNALNVPANATADQQAYSLALATISQYQASLPTGTGLLNTLSLLKECLNHPTISCQNGGATIGSALSAAQTTFQLNNPPLNAVRAPLGNFGSVTAPIAKLETVVVKGLNNKNYLGGHTGTLVLANDVGDTLSIGFDGTFPFATPLGSAARTETISSQPAGQVCRPIPASNGIGMVNPYNSEPVTRKTADFYCFETPCGSKLTLGNAPAPKNFKITPRPNDPTTVDASWTPDPWATSYEIYYGTNSTVITPNPPTNFIVSEHQTDSLASSTFVNVTSGTTYYFVITSIYNSPGNMEVCQSKASAVVTLTPISSALSLSQSSGAAGTTITINGSNFNTNVAYNAVSFNGVYALVTAATSTTLTVIVPSMATSGPVTVSVNGAAAQSAGNFQITVPAPVVSTMVPSSAVAGTSVTIGGSNFSAVASENQVSFNGVSATVTAATSSYLTVIVPSGATSGPVTVTTPSGPAANKPNFTVSAPALPVPTVSSFTPTSGAAGSQITITGTNFDAVAANNVVSLNGIAATVVSSTGTTLVITVPNSATSGTISVKTGGGTATSSGSYTVSNQSASTLTFSSLPTVTGLSYKPSLDNVYTGTTERSWMDSNYSSALFLKYTVGPVYDNHGPTGATAEMVQLTFDTYSTGGPCDNLCYISTDFVVNSGLCYVTMNGANTTNMPSCASNGITVNKSAGTLSIANSKLITPAGGGAPDVQQGTVNGGIFRFNPF